MQVNYYQTYGDHRFSVRELFPAGDSMGGFQKITFGETLPDRLLGFGVALTDSSLYELTLMSPEERLTFLKNIYTPDGLNLSVARISVGSSDYSPELYTYDDGEEDLTLSRFSIERDRKFILPMLKEVLAIRPDLFLYSSPWSPPGWMKTGGSACGGYMRDCYLEIFADYYVRFLLSYQAEGISIRALTPQNEPETDQHGLSVACIWHPEQESRFIGILRQKLTEAGLDPEIWMYDHNFDGWKRVLWCLEKYPSLLDTCGNVAWHYYGGAVEDAAIIKETFPQIKFHFTEGGPRLYDHYGTDWVKWGLQIIRALSGGCRSFTGWNLMLDEEGLPNIGPFFCGGLVTRNSRSGELSYSGQYHALHHFSSLFTPGAEVIKVRISDNNHTLFGYPTAPPPVEAVAARNPDGSLVLTLANPSDTVRQLEIPLFGQTWYFKARPDSLNTLVFK